MLAIAFCFIIASPAAALDINLKDYLQLSYASFTFDKTEITGSEAFQVTVTGHITCVQDLSALLLVREAVATSQVIARHTESGTEVTLNAGYTLSIKPFPDREGETIEISQTVPLQFPVQSASGNYTVIGRILKAKVKFIIGSMDVTSFLLREQPMGIVKYTAPDSSSVQVTTTPPAEAAPPPSSTTPAASPRTEPVKPLTTWWVELIVFIAIATIVFSIVWFLRHRRKEL